MVVFCHAVRKMVRGKKKKKKKTIVLDIMNCGHTINHWGTKPSLNRHSDVSGHQRDSHLKS